MTSLAADGRSVVEHTAAEPKNLQVINAYNLGALTVH
jgi:hypothetical protein